MILLHKILGYESSACQCFERLRRGTFWAPSVEKVKYTILESLSPATYSDYHADDLILQLQLAITKCVQTQAFPMSRPPQCFLFYCDSKCIETSILIDMGFAIFFAMLTVIISCVNIGLHMSHFNNKYFQSKIIVILFMAPFYCFTSIASIVWPQYQAYLTLTRDVYEAVLLFSFFYLIFAYLAYDYETNKLDNMKLYTTMIGHEKEVSHIFPFNMCQKPYQLTSWQKAKYFTYRCKKYILQFLVIKPMATILLYVLDLLISRDSHLAEVIAAAIEWIVCFSISYALYYLVMFYHALKEPLAPYSPLLKFLTIKITLFFTFWQRVVIDMAKGPVLQCFDHTSPHFDEQAMVAKFENTLVCFQMFLMSLAGGIAYTYKNYELRQKTYGTIKEVMQDTLNTFKEDFRLIKPKKRGFESLTEDVELRDLKNQTERESATVDTSLKNNRLSKKLLEDYF